MASVVDGWKMSVEHWWNDPDRERPKYSEEKRNLPTANLSTINLTRIDLGSNPGLRGERPATNYMNHGRALPYIDISCPLRYVTSRYAVSVYRSAVSLVLNNKVKSHFNVYCRSDMGAGIARLISDCLRAEQSRLGSHQRIRSSSQIPALSHWQRSQCELTLGECLHSTPQHRYLVQRPYCIKPSVNLTEFGIINKGKGKAHPITGYEVPKVE